MRIIELNRGFTRSHPHLPHLAVQEHVHNVFVNLLVLHFLMYEDDLISVIGKSTNTSVTLLKINYIIIYVDKK